MRGLFQRDRDALIEMLSTLEPVQWMTPTACGGWNAHEVTLHVLGGDLSAVSRHRDAFNVLESRPGERLGAFLNRINEEWVSAARRFSPQVTVEMLRVSGPPLFAYLEALDPATLGGPVSWAGPGQAPVWLDVAREYMERWVHQQHIRDAVGRPGQTEPKFARPVIAASMHALPVALAAHATGIERAIVIEVEGAAGGVWSVATESGRWTLFEGMSDDARTVVRISANDWWRLVTLGSRPDDAWSTARITGDREFARAVFTAVAIIA